MSDGGKGTERRPQQVSEEEADANWTRIFGKSKKQSFDEVYPVKIETNLGTISVTDRFNHLLKDDEMGFNIKNHIGNDE